MTIRGKFTVLSHKKLHYNMKDTEVTFGAVYDVVNIPEDMRYSESTPSGQIVMLVKQSVADQWPLGKQFYVDFTAVPES